MKQQQPTEVAGALRAIRHDGDPIDQRRRFHRGFLAAVGRHPFLATEGALLGLIGSNHELYAYPVIGGLGAVAVGMAYGGTMLAERQRIKRADALQDIVRTQLDEPVDIVRTMANKQQTLTMRWYGADATADTRETMRRLARLNATAHEFEIPQLAIGTQRLKELVDTETELEAYGDVTEGPRWVADVKRSPAYIEDAQADEAILVSTPDQIDGLLDTLRSTGDTQLLAELIDASGDEQLQAAYGRYQAHPAGGMTELIRQAHVALTRSLDEHMGDETRVIRDMYGNPNRQRVYRTVHVERDRLNILGQSHDTQTGTLAQDHEAADLLHLCGAETLEELIELCEVDNEHASGRRQQLQTAIYLLAQQQDDRRSLRGGPAGLIGDAQGEYDPTLFERMSDEGWPSMWEMMRKRPRTVEYGTRSRLNSLLGQVGLFAASMGLGIGATLGSNALATEFYNQQVEQCMHHVPTYEAMVNDPGAPSLESAQAAVDDCKAYFSGQQPLESAFSQAVFGLSDGELKVSEQTLTWLYDALGPDVLHALIGASADTPKNEWLNQSLQDVPPAYYRNDYSQMFIGDVPSNKNQTIYNVSSPTGRTSAGYWYGDVFDQASVSGGVFQFHSDTLSLTEQTRGPEDGFVFVAPPNEAMRRTFDVTADFVVTSPFVAKGLSDLPVHEGTSVAGAVIVDANDPSKVFTPHDVARSVTTGLYSMYLSQADTDAMWNAGIRTPELKYWLVPEMQPSTHFVAPLEYPAIYGPVKTGEAIPPLDTDAIAAARLRLAHEAKAALGLPLTATDEQVLEAIRDGKTYSVTPFADSGTQIKLPETDDQYLQLDSLAAQIGRLHSLNCNLASAAYLFATADGPQRVDQAAGFHDNGDGRLTQAEAHAWLVAADGTKIDPTPVGEAPKPSAAQEPAHEASPLLADTEAAAAVLAALGALMFGVRRRRDIMQRAFELRLSFAARGQHGGRAMDVLESSLYGAPALRATRDWATTVPFATAGTVTQRLDHIVPTGGLSAEAHQAIEESLANPSLDPGARRAAKRLVRASKLLDKLQK